MPILFRRSDSDSAAFIVWSSVVSCVLRVSLEVSNWLVLWQVYGRRTVAASHLSIVSMKPELVVCNGDVLRGFGPLHYMYGVGIWIPSTIAILIPLVRYGAPRWWAYAMANPRRMRPRALGIIVALVMFFCVPGLPSLPAVLSLSALAAAGGLWWLRNSVPQADPFSQGPIL